MITDLMKLKLEAMETIRDMAVIDLSTILDIKAAIEEDTPTAIELIDTYIEQKQLVLASLEEFIK